MITGAHEEQTVGRLGEFAVIDRINRGRTQPMTTLLGPGDDAAVVAAPDGRVVVTTDMLVQDRHFRLDWSSPEQVGRKAIAQNGADVAAMGARVTGFVVALGCPADTALDVIDGLAAGMWTEAERAGGGLVGGDLVQSAQIVISVTALGDLDGRAAVQRDGAEANQIVALAGRLGWSAAGMAVLRAGAADFGDVVAAHLVPQPHYSAGVDAAVAGATAMTDVSDGLLADLGHVAAASQVGIDVDSGTLDDPELAAAARSVGGNAMTWSLTGGEDHALAAVFAHEAALPSGWRRIGRTVAGAGVTVDGTPWRGETGWESFTR